MDALLPHPSRPQLPLREWACVHAELVWIYESLVDPRFRDFNARGRPGHWAWYIRTGQARVTPVHGAVLEAGPGQWLFPPQDAFRQEFSVDARILSVHFACQWPSGEDMLANSEGLVVPGERYPQFLRRAEQLEHLVRRHFPPDTRHYSRFSEYEQFLDFQVVFLRWLSLWMRLRRDFGALPNRLSVGDDRVLRAISSLNNAPLDAGFPHQLLETATGLGEAHLGRLFFAEHSLTPRKYWEQRRLRVAGPAWKPATCRSKKSPTASASAPTPTSSSGSATASASAPKSTAPTTAKTPLSPNSYGCR